MKRELKAAKPTPIKVKPPTKTQERELSDVMEYMVDQITKRFKNGAIKGMQVGTVEKFADSIQLVQKTTHTHYREIKRHRFYDAAGNDLDEDDIRRASDYDEDLQYTSEEYAVKQPYYTHSFAMADCNPENFLSQFRFKDAQSGNYAKVFLKLASRVQRSIVSRFDDDRIEAMVFGILDKVDTRSRDDFYSAIEGAVGISSKELAATEGMKATTNALKLETAQWVKQLRDETLEMYTSNTLRAMALGNGLDGILDEFDGLAEKRKNHSKMVARNQINNYNSISTKIRAQNLGITQGVWVASMDERTRPSHAERDGKTFDLDKGLYSSLDGKHLLTGTDYACRCTTRFIIPGDDE